ncbi:MAG: arsenate reductase/protein-tyrosine-phosphatase family protein [Thermoleophilia bacterium]
MKSRHVVSLLFVCTGNICRSPLAEAFLKDYALKKGRAGRLFVSSAGTHGWDGNPATAEASMAGARYGLDLSRHRAREVRLSIIEENDLVLAMTIRQHEWLLRTFPEAKNKLYLALLFPRCLAGESPEVADVPDPMGESVEFYLNVLEMLQPALPAILGGALREETV